MYDEKIPIDDSRITVIQSIIVSNYIIPIKLNTCFIRQRKAAK